MIQVETATKRIITCESLERAKELAIIYKMGKVKKTTLKNVNTRKGYS